MQFLGVGYKQAQRAYRELADEGKKLSQKYITRMCCTYIKNMGLHPILDQPSAHSIIRPFPSL